MPKRVGCSEWLAAICSELGPPNPIGRLILIVISQHMLTKEKRQAGTGAWAGQQRIARHTGVTMRTVQRQLKALIAAGWVSRQRERDPGRAHRRTVYSATLPDAVAAQKQGDSVSPCFKGKGATLAPEQGDSGGASKATAEAPLTLKGISNKKGARGAAPGAPRARVIESITDRVAARERIGALQSEGKSTEEIFERLLAEGLAK